MENTSSSRVILTLGTVAILHYPLIKKGLVTPEGAIVVVENDYDARQLVNSLCENDLAAIVNDLKKNEHIPLNYQAGFYFLKKTDTEAMIKAFLSEKLFFPILVVKGIVPAFLEGNCMIFRFRGNVADTMPDLSAIFSWITKDISTVMELLNLSRTSKFRSNEIYEWSLTFNMFIAIADVLKNFFRRQGYSEEKVDEWQRNYLSWLVDIFAEADRFTGEHQVAEAFRSCVNDFCRVNKIYFYHFDDVDDEIYKLISQKKVILFDEEAYYLDDRLFKKISMPLLNHITVTQLKKELDDDNVIIRNEGITCGYTIRKVVWAKSENKPRLRFVKIKKSALFTEDGIPLEKYYTKGMD